MPWLNLKILREKVPFAFHELLRGGVRYVSAGWQNVLNGNQIGWIVYDGRNVPQVVVEGEKHISCTLY